MGDVRRFGVLAMMVLGQAACLEANRSPRADSGVADAAPDVAADAPRTVSVPFDVGPPPDVIPFPDFGPPPTALPLPTGVAPPRKFLADGERLTGEGSSSCTNQEPPSGDGSRWCVFSRAGTTAETTELWVINLTKVVAGQAPACDGSSADCLRMTSRLWTSSTLGGPSHPFSHKFEGDTLIFYADATVATGQIYRGPVYAWRPGWKEPHALTSPAGFLCYGHQHAAVAHCIDDLTGDPMKPEDFALRVGSLDPPPAQPLALFGRVKPFRKDGQVAWQTGFSPDGATFVVSSPDPDPAVESMKVVPTADVGKQPPREILRGVTGWAMGHDGARIFYLRETAADEPDLYAADFPAGTAETKLGTRIGDYLLQGQDAKDRGIAFLERHNDTSRIYRLNRDSRSPDSTLSVFLYRDFLEDVHTSPDLRFTGWLDASFNGRVVRHSDLNTCRLNSQPGSGVFEPLFLENAGLVFWNEGLDGNDLRDAYFGNPDTCRPGGKFATGIGYYLPLGDRGLIYTDEKDLQDHMTLKYAAARQGPAGWTLDTPVRVHEGLEFGNYSVINSSLVVFKTAAGTFVFGPLPF
jgi:hypothetical protein